jgi:hypothetical protein
MVTKRTGRPRTGRPKKDGVVSFLQNPKRNYVMILRGTMEVDRNPSIRSVAKKVAACVVGNEVGLESVPPSLRELATNYFAKMTKAHGLDGMILSFGTIGPVVHKADGSVSYKNTKRGANAATIEGAAEYIRHLDRQAHREAATNPDVARWLRCAVGGFVAAQGAPAEVVAAIFRNSGDPELEAEGPGLARFLNKPVI